MCYQNPDTCLWYYVEGDKPVECVNNFIEKCRAEKAKCETSCKKSCETTCTKDETTTTKGQISDKKA
jgi:hypothetical protein